MMSEEALLPSRQVWSRYGVCSRTIDRWLADPRVAFPRPVQILTRRYWREADLVAWERARATPSGVDA